MKIFTLSLVRVAKGGSMGFCGHCVQGVQKISMRRETRVLVHTMGFLFRAVRQCATGSLHKSGLAVQGIVEGKLYREGDLR